ncbi:MAG TPA: hypothetical protein VHR45_08975 [Thermoanaerobaculia bacterium]|nr:hypothetical protein [Thermoanaerobaculia bacterium]
MLRDRIFTEQEKEHAVAVGGNGRERTRLFFRRYALEDDWTLTLNDASPAPPDAAGRAALTG